MLISLMHPPVQAHLGLKFGPMVDMAEELTKFQSAAGGGHAVAVERGVLGQDVSTGGHLSFGIVTGVGPGVTTGPVPVRGVGGGAGTVAALGQERPADLAGEYSPFGRGQDRIAATVYSAVHDICFAACKQLEGDRRGGVTLKREVGVALFQALLPQGVAVMDDKGVKTSLIQDRRWIRAALFVELTFVLRAGFVVLYRHGQDVHAGNRALSGALGLVQGGGTVPEVFPGAGPAVERHCAQVSDCIRGWRHFSHQPEGGGASAVCLQEVAEGAMEGQGPFFKDGSRNAFAGVMQWTPSQRLDKIAAAFQDCREDVGGWTVVKVSAQEVLQSLQSKDASYCPPVRSYFRVMGLLPDGAPAVPLHAGATHQRDAEGEDGHDCQKDGEGHGSADGLDFEAPDAESLGHGLEGSGEVAGMQDGAGPVGGSAPGGGHLRSLGHGQGGQAEAPVEAREALQAGFLPVQRPGSLVPPSEPRASLVMIVLQPGPQRAGASRQQKTAEGDADVAQEPHRTLTVWTGSHAAHFADPAHWPPFVPHTVPLDSEYVVFVNGQSGMRTLSPAWHAQSCGRMNRGSRFRDLACADEHLPPDTYACRPIVDVCRPVATWRPTNMLVGRPFTVSADKRCLSADTSVTCRPP